MDEIRVEVYGQYRTIARTETLIYPDFEKRTLRELLRKLLEDYPEMSRYLDPSDERTVFSNALFLQGGAILSSLDAEITCNSALLLLPYATGG